MFSTLIFSPLIEQSPCAVIVTDVDGTIEYVNSQFTELTGYTREEVTGKNPRILKSGKTSPDKYKHLWETITSGKKWKGIFCNQKKDGGFYWEMASISPFINEAGIITHFFAIKEDITKQRQKEELLQKNERRLANAQKIARFGSWEWDIVKNEVWWSDEIFRIFGISPREFKATYEAFLSLVHTDDRIFVQKSVNDALYEKKPYAIDHRIVLPDGSIRIVHEEAEVIFGDSGQPLQMNGTVLDITEQKQAENLLIQKLNFERAVSRISARFVALTDIGALVTESLAEIGRLICVDRAYLFRFHANSCMIDTMYEWRNEGIPPQRDRFRDISFSIFSWWMKNMYTGNVVHIPEVSCMPAEASAEKEFLMKWGVKSLLSLPVFAGKDFIGLIGFENILDTCSCGEQDVMLIRVVSEIIGNAIARKRSEECIQHMAFYDALTGLPNRNLFYARLEMAILHVKRSNKMAAVMALDLDGFKAVNDSFGHQAGDVLLKKAAMRMKECVRECDTVARMGGDEFIIILTNIHHRDDASRVAEKLLGSLLQPFLINNNKIVITASIGIGIYPADGNDMETLIKKADNALYCAKKEGKNTYR